MSAKDCIDSAVEAGEMDKERAAQTAAALDAVEAEYRDALGPDGAAAKAKEVVLENARIEAAIKRRRELIAVHHQQRLNAQMARAQKEFNLDDRTELAISTIDSTGNSRFGIRGAEQERKVVLSAAHKRMADVLSNFKRNLLGNTRNRAKLVNVLREAFGEGTGDRAARELAQAWLETAEFLRKQFNAAGGAIPKLEKWGLPQSHDMMKIRRSSFDEWRDFLADNDLLDRQRMIDPRTGIAMSDARLEEALLEVWETLYSDGWHKIKPSRADQGKSVAARRSDHRFLHFRNADSWLKYQDRFGNDDAFATMMTHLDSMARDIGAMRALGPNPPATLRWLEQELKKDAQTAKPKDGSKAARKALEKRRNKINRQAEHLDTLYGHYSGAVNSPSDARVGRGFAALRSLLTAAQLGSAVISAISDIGFSRLTAAHVGLPQWKVLGRQLKLLNPANLEDRRAAVRLGLLAEDWAEVASAQMRYVGEVQGPEVARRLSDGILRASGLSVWTQTGRWAFGMEFMGFLADNAKNALDGLPKAMKETFKRYDISAEEWDLVRKTNLHEPKKGASFLRPDDIRARTDLGELEAEELATKVMNMIQSETEFAVPAATVRGRAAIGGNTRPGTVSGELLRSTLMYKNFALTMYFTHMRRIAEQNGNWNKFKYGTSLIISGTLMGGMALQMKNIANGRDPEPLSQGFVLRALVQGGGLGIFGDFLGQDHNRFGGGLEQTIAGPVAGFMTDTTKLTIGNIQEVIKGETTNVGREAVKFTSRYFPGSSLWYARLALENQVWDQIQSLVDPKAADSWRRQRDRLQKDRSTDFWLKPGDNLIDARLPDLSNALQTGQ